MPLRRRGLTECGSFCSGFRRTTKREESSRTGDSVSQTTQSASKDACLTSQHSFLATVNLSGLQGEGEFALTGRAVDRYKFAVQIQERLEPRSVHQARTHPSESGEVGNHLHEQGQACRRAVLQDNAETGARYGHPNQESGYQARGERQDGHVPKGH